VNCTELEELAGALALGAATPAEIEAARAHLAGCRRGHPALRDLAATAGVLGGSADPADPPPALRDRILAAARADRSFLPEPALVPPAPAARSTPPRVIALPRPGPWPAAVAALLVLAVALGAWNLRLQQGLDRQREQVALQEQAIAAVAAGAEFLAFRAQPAAGAAHGGVVLPREGQPILLLADLPAPAGGGVYQLWPVHDGRHQDIGLVFVPDAEGQYVAVLPAMPGAEGMVITAEPHHVAQPTSDPLLSANLGTAS